MERNMEEKGARRRNNGENAGTSHEESTREHFNQIHPTVSYRNASEYAKDLRIWIDHYHFMNQMNNFYSMMPFMQMSCMNRGNVANPSPGTGQPADHRFPAPNATDQNRRQAQDQRQNVRQTNLVNSESEGLYKVPTFWRRVAAELIDFTLLFYIKLLVTLFLMKRMGHIYDAVDFQELLSQVEIDYDKAFAITTEVIAMEIINRLLITVFETMCLRHGIGTIGGATPGKRLLGLKLIKAEQIIDRGNGLILVSPATDVGWKGAFIRSAIKNFTIAFFLPACLTLFFHSHNRTVYDVLTKTVVVQNANRQNNH